MRKGWLIMYDGRVFRFHPLYIKLFSLFGSIHAVSTTSQKINLILKNFVK